MLGGDREEFLRRAHDHLDHYTGLENYRNSWRRQGFGDEDFVRGGSERLCDAMVVHGDESAIAARVQEHRAAGADHVCLQVLGETTTSVPRDEWRRLAPRARLAAFGTNEPKRSASIPARWFVHWRQVWTIS